jgi:hypothetical protein
MQRSPKRTDDQDQSAKVKTFALTHGLHAQLNRTGGKSMTTSKQFLTLAMAFVMSATVAIAQTRTITIYVSGSGSASESDRQQAMDEATQQAQNWANSSCIGIVVNTNTTSQSCVKLGSEDQNDVSYTCMVTVKAACQIESRGR